MAAGSARSAHPETTPPSLDLVVVDVATGVATTLASGVEAPAWSPDGSTIYAVKP